MPPASDIHMVCFDLGGVLIRICRSWTEACSAAGIEPRHDETAFAALRDDWLALVTLHQTGRLAFDQYTQQASALIDHCYSPQEIAMLHGAWLHGEYANVGAIIDALHEANVVTGCLSNTNREHWQRLPDFPSVMKLRHRHGSHQLGLHKPDPAIYRAFEQRTGFAGGNILFFDDLQDNIDAARRLNWRATRIDPTYETAPQIRAALRELNVLNVNHA